MAASSSATINGSTATTPSLSPVANTIYSIVFTTSASKSLRGLNKPAYIKCYHVARSRSSLEFSSLQKLSNNFAQFNNLRSPLRLKKPLTRKEAEVINEWRFLKMKGYKEGNIEEEKKAFDHHMHNVNLLEEVLAVNSTLEGHSNGGSSPSNPNPTVVGDCNEMVVAGLKLKLRSNHTRTENLRRRLQEKTLLIGDQGSFRKPT